MKIPFLNIYITTTDYKGRYRAKLDRIGDLGNELLETQLKLDEALKLIRVGDKQRCELNAMLRGAQKTRKAAISAGEAMGRRLADKQDAISIAETFFKELGGIGARLGPKANGTLRRICREAGETRARMRSLPAQSAKMRDEPMQRVLTGDTRPVDMSPVVIYGDQASGKSEIGELLALHGYQVCDGWEGSTALPAGTHVAITNNAGFGHEWLKSAMGEVA